MNDDLSDRQGVIREWLARHVLLNVGPILWTLQEHASSFVESEAWLELHSVAPDDDDFIDKCGDECVAFIEHDGGWIWREPDHAPETSEPDEDREHFGTKALAARDAAEQLNIDVETRNEVYEHWAVSDLLAVRLEQAGETVVEWCGMNVWLRCATGQWMGLDPGIEDAFAAHCKDFPEDCVPDRERRAEHCRRAMGEILDLVGIDGQGLDFILDAGAEPKALLRRVQPIALDGLTMSKFSRPDEEALARYGDYTLARI